MLKKMLSTICLIAIANIAQSATITTTYAIAQETTPISSTVDVAKFNDMMGTLQLESVSFMFSGQIDTIINLLNPINKPQNDIGYMVAGELRLTDGANVTLLTLPTVTGTLDLAANQSFSTGILSASDSITATYTDTATLAAFTGADMFSLGFNAQASSTFTGTGNIFTQVQTNALGSVAVTYTYSNLPVSAPAGIAIIGAGLLAFIGYRKAMR